MWTEMFKIGCLFLALWMTLVNFGRLWARENAPPVNTVLWGIGVTGFIYLQ